ncbi:MAG: c-type cytochrome [Gemmatimonas sp.]|jgi:mono/diheme cytochrome c family protein
MEARFSRAARFAALALSVVALATAERAIAQQSADAQPAKIERGKETFAHNCSHCHGINMVNSGTITPDLRKFPGDKQRFVTTVKNGKNNRMPPWGDILTDKDISDLWAYVSSRRTP